MVTGDVRVYLEGKYSVANGGILSAPVIEFVTMWEAEAAKQLAKEIKAAVAVLEAAGYTITAP
jgi:hypothetical protein